MSTNPRDCLSNMGVVRKRAQTNYNATTWSPGFTFVTLSPTDSTIPAPSWPRMTGNAPSGSLPDRVYASAGLSANVTGVYVVDRLASPVWQTPVWYISIRTSWALGGATSTSSMLRGLPASHATAALQVIVYAMLSADSLSLKMMDCLLSYAYLSYCCSHHMPVLRGLGI